MNEETALKINGALCRFYFVARVFGGTPEGADIALLRDVTLAQAQTATEVVEAINAAQPIGTGSKRVRCTVDSLGLPALLTEAKAYKERNQP